MRQHSYVTGWTAEDSAAMALPALQLCSSQHCEDQSTAEHKQELQIQRLTMPRGPQALCHIPDRGFLGVTRTGFFPILLK